MNKVQLYIEGERVDLFEDETIDLSLTIQDAKDPAKIYTDFSQSFTIAATETNNRILKHYYRPEIAASATIDPRKKLSALLSINYVDYKKGQVRVEGVSVEDGRPKNYKITFFGNTVTLPDLFGEDTLADINELNDYSHSYSFDNVKTGFTSSLSSGVIVYPLITHTKRLYYDSPGSDTADGNLDYNASYADRGLDYTDLKPAIKVKAVLDKIATHYGLTFSSTFFDSSTFGELFLWLHRYKGQLQSGAGVEVTERISNWTTTGTNIFSYTLGGIFVFETSNYGYKSEKYEFGITVTPVQTTGKYTIKMYDGEEVLEAAIDRTSTQTINRAVSSNVNEKSGHRVYFEISSSGGITDFSATLSTTKTVIDTGTTTITSTSFTSSANSLLDRVVITDNVPNMKVIDFMSSIFKTFNLTAFVKYEGTGKVYIETLDTYYNSGETLDITKEVDTKSVTVDRALPYKKIEFKYPEAKTYLTSKRNQVIGGTPLGSLIHDGGDTFDGGDYSIETKFEKILYERISDSTSGAATKISWGWFVDYKNDITKVDSLISNPLLFFNVPTDSSPEKISWISNAHAEVTTYNRPANINSDKSMSLHFGSEVDEYNLELNTNSLFSNYYQTYINRLFNRATRIYKYDAKLTASLIQRIDLSDTVVIFDKHYLINKINLNLVTGEAKMELINK